MKKSVWFFGNGKITVGGLLQSKKGNPLKSPALSLFFARLSVTYQSSKLPQHFPPSLLARQVYMIFKINPSFVRASRSLPQLSVCPSVHPSDRLSFYRADMERVVWILLHYSCALDAREGEYRKASRKRRKKEGGEPLLAFLSSPPWTAEAFISNPQSPSVIDQSQLNSSTERTGEGKGGEVREVKMDERHEFPPRDKVQNFWV